MKNLSKKNFFLWKIYDNNKTKSENIRSCSLKSQAL